MSDPRLHIILATAVIEKEGKYLILKRSEREVVAPGSWTIPGGKVVRHEYENLAQDPDHDGWNDILDRTLRKEIKEEAGIEVGELHYLSNRVFIRPDDIPVVNVSYWSNYSRGEVRSGKDITDFAWVAPEELKNYNIIPIVLERIKAAHKIIHKR